MYIFIYAHVYTLKSLQEFLQKNVTSLKVSKQCKGFESWPLKITFLASISFFPLWLKLTDQNCGVFNPGHIAVAVS